LSKSDASRVLRSLPREKAFYFFTSIGNYTGKSAASLKEFAKKILDVNVKSLEFHLYRGDFEKWIAEALEDNVLASKIRQLKAYKPIGMDLRDRLYLIVSKHYEALETPEPSSVVTSFTKPKTATFTFRESQPSGTLQSQDRD
jgi:hypothetical protein